MARWKVGCVALLAVLLTACAAPPPPVPTADGTSVAVARDDASQERGDKLHPQVLARFGGAYDDARVARYVDGIGRRLIKVTPEAAEPWTFTVLDTPSVNAFAIPGGYVYVTRGLVALAEDEAELAGVVAHEIAHVTARHGARRQTRNRAAGAGILLGTLGLAVLGIEPPVVSDILQTALGGTLASYSREDEREADRIGIAYLAASGYDPEAQADFLEALTRNAKLDAEIAGQAYDPEATGFFATHPATAGRSREARETARATGVADGERGRDRHLAAIDGLAWGPSAAQGFVREGSFLHPVLDFAFDIPEGWAVSNRPEAVLLASRDRTRVIFDSARATATDPRAYLTEVWAPTVASAVETGSLQRVERLRIGGAPAARGLMPVQLGDDTFVAVLVAIRRDDRYFRFTGLVPRGAASAGIVVEVTESFRALSPTERRAATQRRIAVVRVAGGDTERSLAQRMAVDESALDRFRVLNDLGPNTALQAGGRVKLIQ
ncbi:MAG: M48 family metalloprotease [Pseudomonadota bacterium]